MTLALIVVCKDSFYIVSDTLTKDSHKKEFKLNTQKSFFSLKHKIGLCISGSAVLTYPLQPDTESIYVDYVLKIFFQYLDSVSTRWRFTPPSYHTP